MAPTFLSDRLSSTVLFSLSAPATRPPCRALNVPSLFPPQGHCTCQSLCLGCTGCRCPYDLFPHFSSNIPSPERPPLPATSLCLAALHDVVIVVYLPTVFPTGLEISLWGPCHCVHCSFLCAWTSARHVVRAPDALLKDDLEEWVPPPRDRLHPCLPPLLSDLRRREEGIAHYEQEQFPWTLDFAVAEAAAGKGGRPSREAGETGGGGYNAGALTVQLVSARFPGGGRSPVSQGIILSPPCASPSPSNPVHPSLSLPTAPHPPAIACAQFTNSILTWVTQRPHERSLCLFAHRPLLQLASPGSSQRSLSQ